MLRSAQMDTYGLLAAWVGITSFLFAIIISAAVSLFQSPLQQWWALTSRARSEKRLKRLAADWEAHRADPGSAAVYELTALYGSLIFNAVAAVGLVMVSIEVLDLGPAILAATLPFNIDAKLLTHGMGLITLGLSYFFILRMSYLGIRLRAATLLRTAGNRARASRYIMQLRTRLEREGSAVGAAPGSNPGASPRPASLSR